jgi:hypothetical protein
MKLEEIYKGRTHLNTDEAAMSIDHRPQTLRKWATYQTGPIQPVKIGRRLLWPIEGLNKLLNGGAK